jgi:oxygen-dependent protoporphyrinogen oxidase
MLDGLIIGGGISGLAAAHFLRRSLSSAVFELWEADDRPGGTIGTDRVEGYSIDWGSNGFLDREPLTLRLVKELDLDDMLERANSKSNDRFIVKHGRLHPVPITPLKMLTTGLLGPLGKLRVFAEPFIPGRRDDGEESVFDFAARRIGRAAAETFVDPMVSGVFGGVASELSLPACFPIMRKMELQYGGLVKAMIARQFEKRRLQKKGVRVEKKTGGPAGPAGHLTSFLSGLDVLIQRLGERLKPVIKLNRRVVRITRQGNAWIVADQTGNTIQAKWLIIAGICCIRDAEGF